LRGGNIISPPGGQNQAKPHCGEQSEDGHDDAPMVASGYFNPIAADLQSSNPYRRRARPT